MVGGHLLPPLQVRVRRRRHHLSHTRATNPVILDDGIDLFLLVLGTPRLQENLRRALEAVPTGIDAMLL